MNKKSPTNLKVGLPGAKEGLSEKDPTLAELLKPQGYVTGQFGKNHLGDRNDFLPTVHGFDEFFGNLYHLNAEDEPVGRPGSGKDDESKRQQLANASRIRKDPNMRPSNPSATLFTMTRYLSTGRSKEWPFQVTSWGHNCPTLSANALVSSPSVRSFT
jgi:arylsulfatase A-like enzyme